MNWSSTPCKSIVVFIILSCLIGPWRLFSQILPVKKSFDSHHYSKSVSDSLFNEIDSLKECRDILEIGTDFTNKVSFWGRDFEIQQIGFQPTFRYKTARGLYFTASQNYWSSSSRPLARTYVGMGYQQKINSWLYSSLSYERCMIHNDTISEINESENYLILDLTGYFNWFSIAPSFNYMFGNQQFLLTDLTLRGDFKLFRFSKLGRVFLQPEVTMTGTTSAYSLFSYEDTNESDAGVTYNRNVDLQSWRIINYEVMLPLTFNYKNFEIKPAYHFAFPVNFERDTLLHPFSYFTVSVTYTSFLSDPGIKQLIRKLKGG